MSTALEAASLVMVPSGYEDGTLASVKPADGTGDFTFSRGSDISATRVNADGYIEKGYENLLLQSNAFDNADWTKVRTNIVGDQSGYDGTNDAWLFTPSTDNSSHFFIQSASVTGVFTISFYAKANGYNGILVYNSGSPAVGRFFDLVNGVMNSYAGAGIDATMTDVGDGWYRCTLTNSQASSGGKAFYISDNGTDNLVFAGDGIKGVLIQDMQINQGLVAYPYIETTAAPVAGGILEDMPRLDYSNGSCPSLLLEPSRTQLIPQSEYLNSSLISRSNDFEINTSDTTSPEGLKNACKFEFPSGSSRYFGDNVGTLNAATASVFVKAGTHQYIQYVSSTTGTFAVNFDVANGTSNVVGTLPSGATYDIEDYGNDWYRIWVSHDHGGTAPTIYWWVANDLNTPRAQVVTSAGDMYFYGFQLEAGTYPTSYIPTYGVSQTRLQDSASVLGIAQSFPLTAYIEIDVFSISNYNQFQFRQDTSSYVLRVGNQIRVGATYVLANTLGSNKIALSVDASGNFELFRNGTSLSTGTITGSIDEIRSGAAGYEVKQILLFPTALSDDECIALTTV